MSSLLAVQIEAFEGRLGTTAAGSTADENPQQQCEAAGDILTTGPSEESDFKPDPTRRRLLKMLRRSSKAYRAQNPFGDGESNVLVGFGSAEDQNLSHHDAVAVSDFHFFEGAKLQISVFDDKTISWRRFVMDVFMAMRHLCLESVPTDKKEEIPVANRTT